MLFQLLGLEDVGSDHLEVVMSRLDLVRVPHHRRHLVSLLQSLLHSLQTWEYISSATHPALLLLSPPLTCLPGGSQDCQLHLLVVELIILQSSLPGQKVFQISYLNFDFYELSITARFVVSMESSTVSSVFLSAPPLHVAKQLDMD